MNQRTIDGKEIYSYIISGAHHLVAAEHALNEINVFPVPDGDTGTNLAFTMRTIIRRAREDRAVCNTLRSISGVALENAYGNSGIIFAQYLHGLSEEAADRERVSVHEFADMARNAVRYAYEAVAEPVEGTILTVMRGWAESLASTPAVDGFESLFERSLQRTRELVQQTRNSLKVLRKNNVVDAGAQGFMVFLEGVYAFIQTGEIKRHSIETQASVHSDHRNHLGTEIVEKNHFCSQYHVKTESGAEEIRNRLATEGDSLVVAMNDGYATVHLHTDRPDRVMAWLNGIGEVTSHRIEDMKLQSLILNDQARDIALVTDSIADVPQELLYRHRITVIPLNLICDSAVYLDKVTMTPELFYDAWDRFERYPTSAQPSVDAIEKALHVLAGRYRSIIGVFVSDKMSGTLRNAQRAARGLEEEGYPVSILDSGLNSAAQGLLVQTAAELIAAGLPHEEIVERLEAVRRRTHIYVIVKDLSYMLRGGRVPRVKGFILKHIRLKPVISIDEEGRGSIYQKTLREEKALEKILAKVRSDLATVGIERYALVYADDAAELEPLARAMRELTGREPEYITQISPVVGLNAGRGAVAVAYIKEQGGLPT